MYFQSRTVAGALLAEQIVPKYAGKPCVVVALSDGAVVVAAQIAMKLHAMLSMLLVQPIMLPREDVPIGGIAEDGSFAYNGAYSPGEIEEMMSEYHSYVDQEKTDKLSEMHRLVGGQNLLNKNLLAGKTVILVSDGLSSGFSLDVAAEYLKPVHAASLVVATPFATVPATDRMHVLADAIFCLNVIENFLTVDHYYDVYDVPKHKKVVDILETITNSWQEPSNKPVLAAPVSPPIVTTPAPPTIPVATSVLPAATPVLPATQMPAAAPSELNLVATVTTPTSVN